LIKVEHLMAAQRVLSWWEYDEHLWGDAPDRSRKFSEEFRAALREGHHSGKTAKVLMFKHI